MEEFARSGQTQKEFSASRGIARPTFNYWLRKLKDENGGASGFVRVETGAADSEAGEHLELVSPNDVKLKARSLSLLSRLIRLY